MAKTHKKHLLGVEEQHILPDGEITQKKSDEIQTKTSNTNTSSNNIPQLQDVLVQLKKLVVANQKLKQENEQIKQQLVASADELHKTKTELKNRKDYQKKLETVLKEMNKTYQTYSVFRKNAEKAAAKKGSFILSKSQIFDLLMMKKDYKLSNIKLGQVFKVSEATVRRALLKYALKLDYISTNNVTVASPPEEKEKALVELKK